MEVAGKQLILIWICRLLISHEWILLLRSLAISHWDQWKASAVSYISDDFTFLETSMCSVHLVLMQSIWSNTFYVNKILVFSWYSSSLLMNLGRFSLLVNYTCTEIRNGGLLFNFRQYLNKIVHSFFANFVEMN